MSGGEALLWGLIGGLLPDVLQLIQADKRANAPEYLKKPWWWVTLAFTIAVGGLAAYLLDPANEGQAIAFGFGAPELIRRLAGAVTNPSSGPSTTLASNTPASLTEYLA